MSSGFRIPVQIAETDVNPIAAGLSGGQVGWVSGSPAGLAAGASVNCVFDLGVNWHQYTRAVVSVIAAAPSSGISNVIPTSSDTVSPNNGRRPIPASVSSGIGQPFGASVTTASAGGALNVSPMGRYLIVTLTNADGVNALGATSKVTIATYPA